MTLTEIYRRCSQKGECKLWKGAITSAGGRPAVRNPFALKTEKRPSGGRLVSGRQIVWRLKHREAPKHKILMTCGNKLCLNVEHMKDATNSEILKAAYSTYLKVGPVSLASRIANGRKAGKLTPSKAAMIREEMSQYGGARNPKRAEAVRQAAARYGVDKSTIYAVMQGKKWAPAALPGSSVWAMNDGLMRFAA